MIANVLILDDDPASRNSLVRSVQTAGMQTIAPPGPFGTMDELRDFARAQGVTHAVTDHRLRERNFSSFLGANAAAALNVMKIAPILVTAFGQQDMDHDIRPHLGFIPRIIRQRDVKPNILREALECSANEVIHGHFPRSRRKYRSIVSVENVVQGQRFGLGELRLMVRQWRKDVTVGYPLSGLPHNIQRALVPGLLLIAQVNIEAESPDTLFLMEFELPPSEDTHDL
jgi:hypothetical protein